MSELLAAIDFGGRGESARYILDGWGQQEAGHRWTVGVKSQVRLPVACSGADCVVVIDGAPWCDTAGLHTQSFMLSINDRLLETIHLSEHKVLAFRMPTILSSRDDVMFRIDHLNANTMRSPAGCDGSGLPLGLLVTSIRVFRLTSFFQDNPVMAGKSRRFMQSIPVLDVEMLASLTHEQLATRFEPIGLNCEFGSVQRHFGAEPLSLLRFAGMSLFKLVDGLMASFELLGMPEATHVSASDDNDPVFMVYEAEYVFWYRTNIRVGTVTPDQVHAAQCRRLAFLRRKFLEDLQASEKIFLLHSPHPISEAEALAVFCALQLEGSNRLLWTGPSDGARAGQIEMVGPGLMRGHLGTADARGYARHEAWISVLANAYAAHLSYTTDYL